VTYKVRFRPKAEEDLFALYNYIALHSGHARAAGYIARIETACMNLGTFPERGLKRDDIAPGIRIAGFERRVTIAFRIEGDIVRIVRVFYAGRDYAAELEQDGDD
jgi:toxin ParE1/3/4